MEQLAAPGSILVTAYTHKLTDGYFEFKDLGADADQRRGRAAPCLRSARRGTTAHALTSLGAPRADPVCGTAERTGADAAGLEQAKAGHGQIVGVMGEPGLGQVSLVLRVQAHLATWLPGAGSLLSLAWQSLALSAAH